MQPETRTTIKRIRKNPIVRKVAVGIAGYIVISAMMNKLGYRMVRPYRFEATGEVFAQSFWGRMYKIEFDK